MEYIAPFEDPIVMIFRGGFDTQEKLVSFSKFFGEFYHDYNKYSEDKPWLFCLANEAAKKFVGDGKSNDNIGGYWHTDYAFLLSPPKYTIIRCVMIPPDGGETSLLDLISAYRDLSDEMKTLLDPLWAIRSNETDTRGIVDRDHLFPLVQTHPTLKKKHLYFSYRRLKIIVAGEVRNDLEEFLKNHVSQEKYVYTHKWKPNDLMIWDNRCTMHKVNFDFDPAHPRWMERIAIVGDEIGKYNETDTHHGK
jgi:taurine dioxygenase